VKASRTFTKDQNLALASEAAKRENSKYPFDHLRSNAIG
jgi:hypothetical protein